MRLESVAVRRYRVHRDLRVAFDRRITLVSGPNESGKSTLAEALHRGLFLRARAGGEVRDNMASPWGEPPQVEIEGEAGGAPFRLCKAFRGTRGECTLARQGERPLSGDAAEERLAALLGAHGPIEGRGADSALQRRWAHLWVWQGTSHQDPALSVSEQHEALVRRLQSAGGAAVMQSALDERVLRAIRDLRDGLFARGRFRAGSEAARAEEARDAARLEWEAKERAAVELREAAERQERAAATIALKTAALQSHLAERDRAARRLQQAEEIERRLEPLDQAIENAARDAGRIEQIGRDLLERRSVLTRTREAVAPAEQAAREAVAERNACAEALRTAEAAWNRAREEAAAADRRRNALAEQVAAMEKQEGHDRLAEVLKQVKARRAERERLGAALLDLPQVAERDLAALRAIERDLAAAEAQLAVLGASIEVLECGVPVTVNGRNLAVGDARLVTDDTEVRIGDHARLRVRPGARTSLAEARQQAQAARSDRADRLAALGVASVEEAAAAKERRDQMQARLSVLAGELAALGDDSIEEQFRRATQLCEEAVRRAAQAAAQAEGVAMPAGLQAAQAARSAADEACHQAERAEESARASFDEARRRHAAADEQLVSARSRAAELQSQAQELLIRIRTLEEAHGTDEQRARALEARLAEKAGLEQRRRVLEQELAALQPAALRQDLERLNQAIERAREAIGAAEQERAAARDRMQSRDTSDPRADALLARARLEQAEARFREMELQAKAVQHLAQLAEHLQRRMAERFTRPLCEKAEGYLACLFGPGAVLQIGWDSATARLSGLRLDRSGAGLGVFPFESLSGGTREQVGVALRLAMAEVLAADHDGCLPVVLDDAFANSDPERTRALQSMLYRAASQGGLQLIVLTSNPDHYSGLGAREVVLARAALPDSSATATALSGSA